MDFQQYCIDERLARMVESLGIKAAFYKKMLEYAVQKNENVCAKINLSQGTEEVCLLPALHWIAAESPTPRKALVLAPDAETLRRAAKAAESLGSSIGASACLVLEGEADSPPSIEGDPGAAVALGLPTALVSAGQAGSLQLREYGFVVALETERLAELPSELMRKLSSLLLPSWERRSVLACSRISVKAKNLAWDLSDNPAEISIEEEAANVQGVPRETWQVATESKFRFLLGLVGREKRECLCVFCNLKGTAEEVARRLAANGLHAKSISAPLPPERQFAMLENAKAGGGQILVLTDEGAEGLTPGSFPLVVNYDVPLEAEYFVRRLEFLDRAAPGAKIVSLACERYMIGLTAIEQYISDKLEVLPADDSLLAPADSSEGRASERPRPRAPDGPRRDNERREDTRRGGRSRGRDSRGARPRGPGERGLGEREDRSPDIRRSISEATGGSLDMTGGSPAGEARRDDTRREDTRREANRESDSRRPDAHRRGQERGAKHRGGEGRKSEGARREDKRREEKRREQQPRPASSAGNPYDLPMEERMRRYREKYGQRLESERSDESRGARPRSRPPRDSEGRAVQPRREDTRRDASSRPQAEKPAPRAPAPEPKEGLFRKLFGSRRREDE